MLPVSMRLRALVLLAAVAFAGATAFGQGVRAPTRDWPNTPPVAPSGTGTIRGRVVDGQTGNALARARVRLTGPGVPQPIVTTDESGAFAFTALPAGSFMVMADKSTYLSARYPDGQTLRSSSRGLSLSEGQSTDKVTIAMYRGGAITGRVLDAHGDPVEYAQVQALRVPRSGRGKPQQSGGTTTNDIGEYRLARLPAGKYLLMVQAQRRNNFESPASRVTSDAPEPHSLPAFYPGVLELDGAQAIAVDRGTTITGADVMLGEGIPARIKGMLVDTSGQAVTSNANVNVRPIVKDVMNFGSSGVGVNADGTFQITLTPGEYEFEGRQFTLVANQQTPGNEQFGSVRINVAGDLTGVVIQLGPGSRVSGRIVFDGTSPVPEPPANANGPGAVMFVNRDGPGCRSGQGQVAPDWTFTVEGVSGTCTAQFNGGIPRWAVKSITHAGRNLMDEPITFAGVQRLRNVEVTLTDKPTQVMFKVDDDRGMPTRDYVGVLFPLDKARWTDSTGRYLRTVVPPLDPPASMRTSAVPGSTAGSPLVGRSATSSPTPSIGTTPSAWRDMVSGMATGEYLAVAVDDIDAESLRDAGFLEQLSRVATRVTVTHGSPITVNLRRVELSPQK